MPVVIVYHPGTQTYLQMHECHLIAMSEQNLDMDDDAILSYLAQRADEMPKAPV